MRIKTGDIVVVTAGKDNGKEGKVLKVLSSKERVVVEGVNVVTKHVKKTSEKAGERIEKEASVHISNVMIVDGEGKASRIKYSLDKKGDKSRVFQTTEKVISENFNKS